MVAADLIPAPDAIPVAWGWLEVLLIVTFAAHILLMNAVVGGALLCLVRSVSFRSDAAVRTLSRSLPTLFALTVNFGVAPLLFAQMLYGQFFYTSSVLMGSYWLSVVFLAIIAYSGLYTFRYKYEVWRHSRLVLAMVCAVLLFMGFLFANNMTMMLQPEAWLAYFADAGNGGGSMKGLLLNTGDPSLLPRYMHFMLAAAAVGGLTLALLFEHRLAKGTVSESEAASHIRFGMMWFSVCTGMQVLVGGAFLGSQPAGIRALFLGGSDLYTGALAIALACVAVVLHYAARFRVKATAVALTATVLAMSLVRALLRSAYLEPYFSVRDLPVHADYSPMILFFVSLLGGLWCIFYMVRLAFRPGREG
ncbi:hypothetical protein N1030_14835 [Desulfovibrio mangrovi]|uniref:hypothetical protein n=1 Tax=Desulfovibrio mangrovi TaxID=2976983 RepID=UPI002245069F|nr:hypothetical protein [Desulfovibrio mangrovi]UZP66870.1 hypothetical protein N1030_14835 [Desulfovibrio mangrovi]